jgi:hypothetical protein
MIITIPTCPGLAPDHRVLQSLYDQDMLPHEIITVTRGLPYSEVKGDRQKMIENICISRNECLRVMKDSLINCDVAAMNDADEMHLLKDNLARGEAFLINNPEYGAAGLYDGRKDENDPDHIMLGCWVIHRRLFQHSLEFSFTWPGCECLEMCKKIRAAGLRVCYLDMEKRLENLKCL